MLFGAIHCPLNYTRTLLHKLLKIRDHLIHLKFIKGPGIFGIPLINPEGGRNRNTNAITLKILA